MNTLLLAIIMGFFIPTLPSIDSQSVTLEKMFVSENDIPFSIEYIYDDENICTSTKLWNEILNGNELFEYPIEARLEMNIEEFKLLCKCVEAEARDRSFESKEAIAEVIINRVLNTSSFKSSSSIEKTIYAPKQFEVVSNGSINKVIPKDDTVLACTEALYNQHHPDEMLFFRSGHYFSAYEDYKEIDGTYFSLYYLEKN